MFAEKERQSLVKGYIILIGYVIILMKWRDTMNSTKRRMKIFELLKEKEYVEVAQLAEFFNVSTMTIRRDLLKFEKQGILTTNYGGAVLNEGTASEPSFDLKAGHSHLYKQQIAYEASHLIENGDTIIIDCGTTAYELAHYLSDKRITVITNSWKVIGILHKYPKVALILAPGEYDPISEGVISSVTIDFFKNYTVDKAFISTQGVDIKRGVSVPNHTDAQVKKALMQAAKSKILLVDHSKFNQVFLAKHGDLTDFDMIISDLDISQKIVQELHDKNINIVIAKSLKKDSDTNPQRD